MLRLAVTVRDLGRRRDAIPDRIQTLALIGPVETQGRGIEMQKPRIEPILTDCLQRHPRHQSIHTKLVEVIQRLGQPLLGESRQIKRRILHDRRHVIGIQTLPETP